MKKKKRLLWQLYPSYLLITLIALVTVAWYASDSLRYFFLDQTAADLEARARFLERQIVRYLAPEDVTSIDLICKEIGASAATRLTVILSSGQVVGDSEEEPDRMDNHADRPEVTKALTGSVGVSTRFSRTLQISMMYVAIPLKENNRIIAVLRTSLPLTSIDEKLRGTQIRIALGGLLIALLAAGISWLVSRRISRPMEEMKQSAEHFANGDLQYRLPVQDAKEMESLALAMNRMAAQLDERIKTAIRQRNEFEAVLSSMVEGVIALDREERILNINQAAAKMFGLDSCKLQGRSIQETVRNAELQRFVQKALASAEPTEDDIFVYHTEERILHIHSAHLVDAKADHIGILVVLIDVTRLKRLENMRRDFVANVSHEIKTPLTAIKGFVETLQNGAFEKPEESQRFLGIIEKHVNRLNSIIDDLLSLSRLEQEGESKEIKLEKGSIKEVIQTAVLLCQAKAGAKNIRVNLLCEEEIIGAIEPTLLEHAVVNLLDNAIQYSKKESEIQIAAVQTDSEINISIKDHGVGIAREHRPRIFERFYRADKARSRELGGTGLGLAIVKHIVQAHGGQVAVESVPGQGSTFTIHLPKI
ncbi:MAG: PAS domain-containing sensor histidine kinase [Deltaproteobacteria bacterium CG1_02_45_11]|nr:MAG: PAS domain-containing sensor histidine kinase [Deltaproteobacteria bacterium CG1_02_45_11]